VGCRGQDVGGFRVTFYSRRLKSFRTYVKICIIIIISNCRSEWPRGLRRRYRLSAEIVGSFPPRLWMSVSCKSCVLSRLCDELITHPEKCYRLRRVVVCDLQPS